MSFLDNFKNNLNDAFNEFKSKIRSDKNNEYELDDIFITPTLYMRNRNIAKFLGGGVINNVNLEYLNNKKLDLLYKYEDPVYLSFVIDFEINKYSAKDLIENYNDSLNFLHIKDDSLSSPVVYLYNNGYILKSRNLREYKKLLEIISIETPWNIKSISGVPEIFKFTSTNNYFAKDKKITINFNVGFDGKTLALFDLYKFAVYDFKWMRYNLPDNMRKFNMTIYILDSRDLYSYENVKKSEQNKEKNIDVISKNNIFNKFINSIEKLNKNKNENTYLEYNYNMFRIYNLFWIYEIRLLGCEWDIENLQLLNVSDISNEDILSSNRFESFSIDVTFSKIEYSCTYPLVIGLLDNINDENFSLNKTSKYSFNENEKVSESKPFNESFYSDKIKVIKNNFGKNEKEDMINNFFNDGKDIKLKKYNILDYLAIEAEERVKSKLNKLYLGNLRDDGLSLSTTISSLTHTPQISDIKDAKKIIDNIRNNKNDNIIK